jgi:hypothetical protein
MKQHNQAWLDNTILVIINCACIKITSYEVLHYLNINVNLMFGFEK